MGRRVPPFLRHALLCRKIERDARNRPVGLVDPLHTISILQGQFGQPLTAVFLYAQLEDGVGSFDLSVRVEDENGIAVAQPNLRSVEYDFDGDSEARIIPLELSFGLSGLVIPTPGLFHFIVRADTQSLHQREFAARSPLLRVLSA
jgi:hypothetical protein